MQDFRRRRPATVRVDACTAERDAAGGIGSRSDKAHDGRGGETAPGIGVCKPFDEKPATHGNGTMVAIVVDSKEKVDQLYALALKLGATDEGKPGPRGEGFYAAYWRDLDGNKLNFFHMG